MRPLAKLRFVLLAPLALAALVSTPTFAQTEIIIQQAVEQEAGIGSNRPDLDPVEHGGERADRLVLQIACHHQHPAPAAGLYRHDRGQQVDAALRPTTPDRFGPIGEGAPGVTAWQAAQRWRNS